MNLQLTSDTIHLYQEPQFVLPTVEPLVTLSFNKLNTFKLLGIHESGDPLINSNNQTLLFSVQVYLSQVPYLEQLKPSLDFVRVGLDTSPPPRCYRWVRWFDMIDSSYSERFGKYMVGHCLPDEFENIQKKYGRAGEAFYFYPKQTFPTDYEEIWVLEDEVESL